MCHDRIEPILDKLTHEWFERRTADTLDKARLDVAARGFWAAGQVAFVWHKSFLLICYQIRSQKSPTMFCFEQEWKEGKV